MNETWKVPTELANPIFFPKDDTLSLKREDYQAWRRPVEVFSYELLFYRGEEAYLPWNERDKHIPELLAKWKDLKTDCEQSFIERKAKEALGPMKEGMGLFLSVVYWMHGKPVNLHMWKYHLADCPQKPVNLIERLSFIMEMPAFYHSFRQLCELFIEQEKIVARSKLQKARRSNQ